MTEEQMIRDFCMRLDRKAWLKIKPTSRRFFLRAADYVIREAIGKRAIALKVLEFDLWNTRNLEAWTRPLLEYSEKIAKKPGRSLLEDDAWLRLTLPQQLRDDGFLEKEDLIRVMKWKLTRGKFRPRLLQLVEANTEEDVREKSKVAMDALGKDNVGKAVTELSKLKGVGPATASAIIAAARPDLAGFFADESVQATGMKLAYTKKAVLEFFSLMREKAQDLGPTFNANLVSQALWSNAN